MRHGLCVLWVLGSLSPLALGGVPDPDFGMDWATIGDPGNRGVNDTENRNLPAQYNFGGVSYTYQMAVTEVTVGQYAEFAQAYAPLYRERTGNYSGSADFTGFDFQLSGNTPLVQLYGDVSPNQPIEVSWEYAARYVNWLHNGKGTDAASFDQGVYDTSTFTQNPDGSWNHTLAHNDNASVWMASLDEWTKAAYWDPNKDGGEGGYWRYPNGSDVESVPYEERNNGSPDGDLVGGDDEPLDVGQFPGVQSPWGILDMSGGASEWSETATTDTLGTTRQQRRWVFGSSFRDDSLLPEGFTSLDMIDHLEANTVFVSRNGIRLVRPIPTPGSMGVCGLGVLVLATRRRR